jgi:hypothetical protein
LHIVLPQRSLLGVLGPPVHSAWLQDAPGAVQIPQLALQQTCPTSHVLGPHITLADRFATPQSCCVQLSFGAVQMPQLALQHF